MTRSGHRAVTVCARRDPGDGPKLTIEVRLVAEARFEGELGPGRVGEAAITCTVKRGCREGHKYFRIILVPYVLCITISYTP